LKRILFDLEGDGLLPSLTKIHCICTVDVDTEETRDFGPNDLNAAVELLWGADVCIAHYGIGYDFPALEKVLGFVIPPENQLDTVVLARLKRPNIKELDGLHNKTLARQGKPVLGEATGKHTVEAWGLRLGVPKLHVDTTDWSEWTPQIQERCHGDVQTALKLWKHLDPDNMSQAAVALEHRIQRRCIEITAAGWPFDVRKAGLLHATLLDEKHKVETALKLQFGGWWKPKGKTFTPKRDNATRGYVAGAPFTKIEWHEFNPGSHQDVERCLRKLGWEPEEFTDSGLPKLDEEQLENITAAYPQAQGLTRYLMIAKRLGQLATGNKAWLNFVGDDGNIHGSYNPMGTVTSRASHFDPNIAQVPAVSAPYGAECRELFTVPEGWALLGADMQGLEARCLAHYLAKYDGGAYGEALLSGDPHWAVVQAIGFLQGERDKDSPLHTIVRDKGAKTAFYAMMYGAGAEKVGRIILDTCRLVEKTDTLAGRFLFGKFFGGDMAPGKRKLQKAGAAAKRAVIEGIPGFADLMRMISKVVQDAEDVGRRPTLPGLDGRRLPVRSEHSALNTLLQAAGAVLCKRWHCDAYDALVAAGLKWGWDGDFVIVGWIHDELQIAVRKGLEEKVGAVVVKAAQEAGKPYGFRLKIDSSFKVGANWKETH
jgi:DNA polymerase-1